MEPGAISELSLSDDVAFHVDFPDKTFLPTNSMRYWRGPATIFSMMRRFTKS